MFTTSSSANLSEKERKEQNTALKCNIMTSSSSSSSSLSQEFKTSSSSQEFRKSRPSHPIQSPTKSCLKRSAGPDESSCNPKTTKSVAFDSVAIKEFPMILGDNPSPNDGVPVTISWKPQRKGYWKVDYFELHHKQRRHGNQLKLSAVTRAKLAVLGGAKITELGETSFEIAQIQKRRAQSSQKGALELLREGFDRRLHPNRKISAFSRVPNEAPRILSNWKANADRMEVFVVNAAA